MNLSSSCKTGLKLIVVTCKYTDHEIVFFTMVCETMAEYMGIERLQDYKVLFCMLEDLCGIKVRRYHKLLLLQAKATFRSPVIIEHQGWLI